MPKMRAKMVLNKIEQFPAAEVLHFNAVPAAKYPEDGSDEDNTFAKFSPSATVSLTVANPALLGQFKAGEKYYVDFTPAE
ncbi:hypothetical protein Herbaro_09355 [Herbaspirillum sp. WKF16]|uniref:hypothetical protein n=1 Tax=Herbaspirillum sp. WKF16 TaxID=3028312 RepID=UPI0023AA150B|nr:hypothetical protein [Herbaspirillum sp. WKF16]WDZ97967.1 hypothetical protein Herbaro_09355 [Herbaspirillum sp. WKF16]